MTRFGNADETDPASGGNADLRGFDFFAGEHRYRGEKNGFWFFKIHPLNR